MMFTSMNAPPVAGLPADLVMAVELHRIAGMIERVPQTSRDKTLADDQVLGDSARALLMQLGREGSLSDVLKALAATGGPSTVAEIAQRLRAVIDQRRQDSGTPAADAPGACGHPKAPAKESSQ